MSAERIGVFGGTFDPPHLGHLILATEAQFQLGLDRLLWVLTPMPPHKTDRSIVSLRHRLAMTQAAIADNPAFGLSRVEIDRPGPHYALDTVIQLQHDHPHAELFYLIGGDSLHDLPAWHRPQEFLQACDGLGVMRRPGDDIDLTDLLVELPDLSEKICFIDAPLLEISSSQIRERVAQGHPYRYYVFPPVYRYIQQHGLYRHNEMSDDIAAP